MYRDRFNAAELLLESLVRRKPGCKFVFRDGGRMVRISKAGDVMQGTGVRLLVFGGRDFRDRAWLYRELDDVDAEVGVALLIEGEAAGADRLARQWAESRRVPVLPFPADWDDITVLGAIVRKNKFGRLYNAAAGPMRNSKMLHEGRPDMAIGFPGGSGTRDMADQCLLAGIMPRMMVRRRPWSPGME